MTDQNEIIALQRDMLRYSLSPRLERLAKRCEPVWEKRHQRDQILSIWLRRIPHSRLIYATDTGGIQVSANVYEHELAEASIGQDLSQRPYFDDEVAEDGLSLSRVYISSATKRPCITVVRPVHRGDQLLGYLVVDFELRDLPLLQTTVTPTNRWQQISGDPAIQTQVMMQRRNNSAMDCRIGDVMAIIDELICERGIFHAKLHFSSSRATLWLMDDPYRYRIHVLEEIMDPSVCMAYTRRAYPTPAVVKRDEVSLVLDRFVELRFADPRFYLRSGSLNIMNGLVELKFSSDGSHYIPVAEFLDKNQQFWMGYLKHLHDGAAMSGGLDQAGAHPGAVN
jgi:hypothetical protein